MLLNGYGVTMEIDSTSPSSRVITLNATTSEGVTPSVFEEVHLSLYVVSTSVLKSSFYSLC